MKKTLAGLTLLTAMGCATNEIVTPFTPETPKKETKITAPETPKEEEKTDFEFTLDYQAKQLGTKTATDKELDGKTDLEKALKLIELDKNNNKEIENTEVKTNDSEDPSTAIQTGTYKPTLKQKITKKMLEKVEKAYKENLENTIKTLKTLGKTDLNKDETYQLAGYQKISEGIYAKTKGITEIINENIDENKDLKEKNIELNKKITETIKELENLKNNRVLSQDKKDTLLIEKQEEITELNKKYTGAKTQKEFEDAIKTKEQEITTLKETYKNTIPKTEYEKQLKQKQEEITELNKKYTGAKTQKEFEDAIKTKEQEITTLKETYKNTIPKTEYEKQLKQKQEEITELNKKYTGAKTQKEFEDAIKTKEQEITTLKETYKNTTTQKQYVTLLEKTLENTTGKKALIANYTNDLVYLLIPSEGQADTSNALFNNTKISDDNIVYAKINGKDKKTGKDAVLYLGKDNNIDLDGVKLTIDNYYLLKTKRTNFKYQLPQ